MGVAQKSTVSTIYSGVDLGVSATTDKSIREHILGDGTTDTEGSHLQRDVDQDGAITWVTPKYISYKNFLRSIFFPLNTHFGTSTSS